MNEKTKYILDCLEELNFNFKYSKNESENMTIFNEWHSTKQINYQELLTHLAKKDHIFVKTRYHGEIEGEEYYIINIFYDGLKKYELIINMPVNKTITYLYTIKDKILNK